MPRPITLVLTIFPVAILGIGYYHHRRLSAAYPTLRVPPALEISPRHDWPAFGMTGGNSDGRKMESWRHTHAGDMFVATVPRRLLEYDIPEDTPLVVFARAFWGSWPLMIEKRIVHMLARFGVLFQTRGGHVGAEGEHSFVETARILGGLFVVETHEAPLGPLVTSWWLRPSEGFPKPGRVGILGGYHSFVVEDRPQIGNEPEPTVRLCFVSHLVLSGTPTSDVVSESIPARDLQGLSLRQTLIMHFHILYSRILLDLAMHKLQGREYDNKRHAGLL
ncbi:hypothetical protein DFH08DRAFT_888805 [Mycena albidolilacea]|uniref:Uncharacterized protein n=1 Tax=Mycena albidolilacea TaxID=1033008 RepID=A0AAD6ZHK2_9AGAR|nr:hypothetical protein DFH08DRAFT_888805 [Mycena albidolilacea]